MKVVFATILVLGSLVSSGTADSLRRSQHEQDAVQFMEVDEPRDLLTFQQLPYPYNKCPDVNQQCKALKGTCALTPKWCPYKTHFYDSTLCGSIFSGKLCGCCHPVFPCVNYDEKCADKPNGFCVWKREQCPTWKAFDPTLCASPTADPNIKKQCGCCYDKKPPCFHDPRCKEELGGFCVKHKKFCPTAYEFSPKLCRNDVSDDPSNPFVTFYGKPKCGCCYPPRQCVPSADCQAPDGSKICNFLDDCPVFFGTHTWDHEKCNPSPNDGAAINKKCGCCERIQHVPCTDTGCDAVGGYCVKNAAECKEDTHYFNPNAGLCSPQSQGCGCCQPIDPPLPCEPTEKCKSSDGVERKCVSSINECPLSQPGYTFNPEACQAVPGTPPNSCGCCEYEPPCESTKCDLEYGTCIDANEQDEKCNKQFFEFDDTLCTTANNSKKCGCCKCKTVPKCAAQGGKCVPINKGCDKKFFVPGLCDESSTNPNTECACCYDEPVTDPPCPTAPCKENNPLSRCVATQAECDGVGEVFEPNNGKCTKADGTQCGCCYRSDLPCDPNDCNGNPNDLSRCVKNEAECRAVTGGSYTWDPDRCTAGDPTVGLYDGNCGCCTKV